jgi:addiction module HigA family antidote
MRKKFEPIHPGNVLLEEFLKPMNISQHQLAKDIHMAPGRIREIILFKRAVTADTALRLSRYFGNSPVFWMNLQLHYDLEKASDRLKDDLKRTIKSCLAA